MLGWLVLNLGSLRSHQLGAQKTLRFGLAWLAIFGFVAFLASWYAG
jgi:hypothetical protein